MPTKPLTQEEISTTLLSLSDWSVADDKLEAEFTFKDFRQAFAFMSEVAQQFEKINHHPTWSNTYNKVSFIFSTHDAGDKITNLDIEMAKFVSQSANKFS